MGHRCNLVIIENGTTQIYYDHWAANRLDQELFWGPKLAYLFIKQLEPTQNFWSDDVYCEGGCVLDCDNKHLIWFGGDDIMYDASENLIHSELMKVQWEGWNIEWATDGVYDIAEKAGIKKEFVMSNSDFKPNHLEQARIDKSHENTFLYANGITSFTCNNQTKSAVLHGELASLAHSELTKKKLLKLINEFPVETFERVKKLGHDWPGLEWGAHFDFNTMSITSWCPNPDPGLIERLQDHWHGWTLNLNGPDYLWHKAILPTFDWPKADYKAKKNIIDRMRKHIHDTNTNPMLNIMKETDFLTGKTIKINPATLINRDNKLDHINEKNIILNILEKSLFS